MTTQTRTTFHPTPPQPTKTAIQIALAMYASDRRTERVPVIVEFDPRQTVNIVACPPELTNLIPLVSGLAWEVL